MLSFLFDRCHGTESTPLVPRLTPHALRHTWATLALQKGINSRVVADRLGHSSVTVTLDRYCNVTAGLDTDAAEQVASLIDGST